MSGNKASNLHTLSALGFPVPDFYVIGHTDLQQLNDKHVEQKLLSTFAEWRQRHDVDTVAIRSSADAEDGADKSYAGQFISVMNVNTNKQFIKALKKVANSKPLAGYESSNKHRVHAIVQRYIEPTVAGVAFTVNPSNGRAEILINAASGHGSAVVDGRDSISYHVDRVSQDIQTHNKQSKLLSNSQLLTLATISISIESHMGEPQDIEWAWQDDNVFILQTRPITKITYLKAWDNANIGESFPGIVMPLTFSIARRGYELVYKSQGYAGGLSWYQLEANHRTFHDMVGLFNGRMYYNLASWYRFMGLFPGNQHNQKFLDDQLQTVGDIVYLPPSSYPSMQALRYYGRVLWRILFFDREKQRYWRQLDKAFAQYSSLPIGKDLPLLLDRYTFVEQMIVPLMGKSADNDFLVMTYHGLLKTYINKWLGKDSIQTTHFLGSLHDVISARQAELLAMIASAVNHDNTAKKYLKSKQYQKLDTHLLAGNAQLLIEEYRTKFLHRFAGDQKIEATNPLLSLDGFYTLVAVYCKLDEKTLADRHTAALAKDQERHRDILRQLGPTQKILYRFLLHRLKKHLRIREHNRLLRGKTYALLRDLFPAVGEAFVVHGIIDQPHDVYYLDIEEILRYTNGTGYNDNAKRLIAERKARYKTHKDTPAPSRFITTNLADEMPPMRHFGKPVDVQQSLPGTLSSPGNIRGKIIVLDEPIIPKEPFDILVVSHTDPGWTPLIALAKGVIVEHGGILSHAAIVTRELGIPSIIGVKGATSQLRSGMTVRINSAKSTVDIIK